MTEPRTKIAFDMLPIGSVIRNVGTIHCHIKTCSREWGMVNDRGLSIIRQSNYKFYEDDNITPCFEVVYQPTNVIEPHLTQFGDFELVSANGTVINEGLGVTEVLNYGFTIPDDVYKEASKLDKKALIQSYMYDFIGDKEGVEGLYENLEEAGLLNLEVE